MTNVHYHLDLLGGLAGDMFLAAVLDAGLVEKDAVEQELRKVGLGSVRICTERVIRGAIEGTRVWFEDWDASHDADHRHLSEIREMLAASGLDEAVKGRARALFEMLGQAESSIHGIELDRVHFHEVGAVDSILDFVAAAVILEKLGGTWSFGEVPVGSGTIETAHGTIPVPAPATARLLEGMQLVYQEIPMEFVTPTGATILADLQGLSGRRSGVLKASGFGCGTRDPEGISNVVRILALAQEDSDQNHGAIKAEREKIVILTSEIDDQNPEELADAARLLLEEGARDVVLTPVQMKKGRPGTRISLVVMPEDEGRLVTRLFESTTTFGVRRQETQRWVLKRSISQVATPYGEVEVKLGWWGEEVLKVSPEYESCAEKARRAGVSLREVYLAAQLASRNVNESS